MVWHNFQGNYFPPLFFTLETDETLYILSHASDQNRLSTLWAKDDVIKNQMDPVFITLILHVDIIAYINRSINNTRLILSD